MSAPTAALPRARRRSPPALALILPAAAVAIWLALPYVTLSPDARYSLAWGAQLTSGSVPDIADVSVSTAHPLPVALGTLLSLLGAATAADLYAILSLAAFGLLLYAVFRLGRVLGGPWAGALAVLLVATRPRLDFFAAHGFVDVPFAALVVLAAAMAAERPGARSLPALGLLSLAGLLRPEVWVVSAVYAAWLVWSWRGHRERGRRTAAAIGLAASAPVAWMLFDLALSGDPLLSLSGTQERTDALALPTGIENLLPTLDDGLEALVGWPLVAAGALTATWALAGGRAGERTPFAVASGLALTGIASFVGLAVTDLPLNDRYLVFPALALCALAAAALPSARRAPVALVALGVALVGVALAAPDDYRDTERMLELAREKHSADGDLERLLGRSKVRDELRRCAGLVVAGTARPAVAAQLELDPASVPRATGPLPAPGRAAISTSDTVGSRARGATRVGAWTFVSRC